MTPAPNLAAADIEKLREIATRDGARSALVPTHLIRSALDALATAQASAAAREEVERDNEDLVSKNAGMGSDLVDALIAKRTAEARVAVLKEALRFYGDVSKYPAPLTGGFGALWSDCGELARAALSDAATTPRKDEGRGA